MTPETLGLVFILSLIMAVLTTTLPAFFKTLKIKNGEKIPDTIDRELLKKGLYGIEVEGKPNSKIREYMSIGLMEPRGIRTYYTTEKGKRGAGLEGFWTIMKRYIRYGRGL